MPKRRRRRLHAAMTVAALSALATACQEREKQVVLFDLGHHPIGEPAVVLDRLEAALGEQGFESVTGRRCRRRLPTRGLHEVPRAHCA